jgi:hypothetical protein
MSTEVTTQENNKLADVFKGINEKALTVLKSNTNSIEHSLIVAGAITYLQEALTAEVMKPIMALQGSRLGFKTDRDLVKNQQSGKYEKGPGYPLEVVKNCFIEASLSGLMATGNQWNIIGGNFYITKEGGDHLVKSEKLDYNILYKNVEQSADKKTASVIAEITWKQDGSEKKQEITWPIKSDAFTTFDSLIGKAERKSKVWLYNKVKGTCLSDGDASEIPTADDLKKQSASEVSKNKEYDRVMGHISHKSTATLEILQKCLPAIRETDHDLIQAYSRKHVELSASLDELNSLKFISLINEEYDFDLFILLTDKKKELTPKAK